MATISSADGPEGGQRFAKLVYVLYLPLTSKIERDLYIRHLIRAGVPVEYWDLSGIFETGRLPGELSAPYVRQFTTYDALAEALSSEPTETMLFNVQLTYEWRTVRLFRLLTKCGCVLSQFDRPGFPAVGGDFGSGLSKLLNPKNYVVFARTLLCRALVRVDYIRQFDIVFAAGTNSVRSNQDRRTTLAVNHFDYDRALETRIDAPLVSEPYGVFLEEYLPFHPDFRLLNMGTVEPKKYYSLMNRFFKAIEAATGYRIVIAGHPKGVYTENPYEARHLAKDVTENLVRHARFVLTHASTSLSFAIIYEKPLVFITTDQFEQIYRTSLFALATEVSGMLGAPMINIEKDSIESLSFPLAVNKSAYKKYLMSYLTTELTSRTLTSDVIAQFVLGEPGKSLSAHPET